MNFAFIVSFANFQYSGGITVQGRMWKESLEALGHHVSLINCWDKYDWNSFDYVVFFGTGKLMYDYVHAIKRFSHPKMVSAPIIDWNKSMFEYKLRCKYGGSIRMRWHMPHHDFYSIRNFFSFFLVRSQHEKNFLKQGLGIPESKIHILPLSFRIKNIPLAPFHKENFVFHASRLADPGKNVERLVKSAIKYEYQLVLAGTLNGDEKKWLDDLISGHSNIKYVGWISDEQLYDYYSRAKVLALPSLIEGVGMVALEAAVYGCEIVLTNLGAPKEYWGGQAYLVDPYDIDSIGSAVVKALSGEENRQPKLRDFVVSNYNEKTCTLKLQEVFLNNLK